MKFIYLLGVPGAGKSTITQAMFDRLGVDRGEPFKVYPEEAPLLIAEPLEHVVSGEVLGWSLGKRNPKRPGFPGTDAMSTGALPHAVRWALDAAVDPELRPRALFGEGHRLGDHKLIGPMAQWADVTVVYIDAPEDVLEARRVARGQRPGLGHQMFIKGARTRSNNTAAWLKPYGVETHRLDSSAMTASGAAKRILELADWH